MKVHLLSDQTRAAVSDQLAKLYILERLVCLYHFADIADFTTDYTRMGLVPTHCEMITQPFESDFSCGI
jgi:hypothetical protein